MGFSKVQTIKRNSVPARELPPPAREKLWGIDKLSSMHQRSNSAVSAGLMAEGEAGNLTPIENAPPDTTSLTQSSREYPKGKDCFQERWKPKNGEIPFLK